MRELILPDTRGTGESAVPADPATYRCDRLARDVEALRAELGLERFDLLGHSAGGSVALLYAAAYPERIGHLVLLSPGMGPLGLQVTDAQQQAAMRRRSGEPWYQDAWAAVQAAEAGDGSAETRLRYMPFFYSRWDDAPTRSPACECTAWPRRSRRTPPPPWPAADADQTRLRRPCD
jgi:pimeloyl-ACP methyl ester carboxylesterase